MEEKETTSPESSSPARNEPCPCGSGKKYKRCHGVAAAPKLGAPKAFSLPEGAAGQLPFDPSKLDPAMMSQAQQAIQRLPRGQLQRLQSVMQRAMSGQDVTQEMATLEQSLPPDFRALMMQMMMSGGGPGMPGAAGVEAEMTPEQAREIVEKAAREGKVSADQAHDLLDAGPGLTAEDENKGGLSKFWRSVKGK